ncbi:MAG: DUF3445 domain-containing protein [Alphaproteobacteria bacterium]|nr:DUF3445 domain-containing protein [Alphaproteobacteria bacterium]
MMVNPAVSALLAQAAAQPHRPQMGLVAIPERAWIQPGPDLREKLVLKRQLLAERHDEVFGALPGTEDAGSEVADLLFDTLPRHFPTTYPRMGSMFAIAATSELIGMRSPGLHPLDLAGRIVPDDLCLMQADASGTYRLTAASLCFPSRWRLHEKLGRPVGEIHEPVPAYGEVLQRPVDRFFGALAQGRIVQRVNWTIHDRPDLFQPQSPRRHEVPPERFGSDLFLRSERQTLRRLARSQAILFTIDTQRWPLAELSPEDARNLGAAIAQLPEPERRYKGVSALADGLAAWLARR